MAASRLGRDVGCLMPTVGHRIALIQPKSCRSMIFSSDRPRSLLAVSAMGPRKLHIGRPREFAESGCMGSLSSPANRCIRRLEFANTGTLLDGPVLASLTVILQEAPAPACHRQLREPERNALAFRAFAPWRLGARPSNLPAGVHAGSPLSRLDHVVVRFRT